MSSASTARSGGRARKGRRVFGPERITRPVPMLFDAELAPGELEDGLADRLLRLPRAHDRALLDETERRRGAGLRGRERGGEGSRWHGGGAGRSADPGVRLVRSRLRVKRTTPPRGRSIPFAWGIPSSTSRLPRAAKNPRASVQNLSRCDWAPIWTGPRRVCCDRSSAAPTERAPEPRPARVDGAVARRPKAASGWSDSGGEGARARRADDRGALR